MKRLAWFTPLTLLAFSFLAVFPLSAGQRIEGLWLVEKEEAHIKIERCGDRLCARIVWMKEPNDEKGNPRRDIHNPDGDLRDRPILGMNLLKDVPAEPNGNGVWSGGRIYDPQRGRYFRCTIRLDEPNRLRLRGYLGISLLGRTTRWTRISPGESPALGGVRERENAGASRMIRRLSPPLGDSPMIGVTVLILLDGCFRLLGLRYSSGLCQPR